MNMDVLNLSGDDAVVSEVVQQYFPAFTAHGFHFQEVTLEGSEALGRFPVFHFHNQQTGMRIDISFFAAAPELNGGFNVLIIKPVNHKLDVEDYLKAHQREMLTKYFTYRGPAADMRSFAEIFMQMFAGLLDRDLKPIVDGNVFEETPIDWMGYK